MNHSVRNRISPRRFPLRISGFLTVAVLTAGLISAACPSAAQETSPAAATQQAAPAQPAASQEAPKSQEEQNRVFLLEGPLVKWTAQNFGLSREIASDIFQFFNFAIIFLLIVVPVLRVMPKIFRKRSETLGHSLKEAREATANANARLNAVEAKLAGLDEEIKKFRAQVEQESLEDEKRIKASLADENARILEAAEQDLNVAAQQARRNLRQFAANLAIEQAAQQLVLTPEIDRALIAEFARGAESNGTGSKGGQN